LWRAPGTRVAPPGTMADLTIRPDGRRRLPPPTPTTTFGHDRTAGGISTAQEGPAQVETAATAEGGCGTAEGGEAPRGVPAQVASASRPREALGEDLRRANPRPRAVGAAGRGRGRRLGGSSRDRGGRGGGGGNRWCPVGGGGGGVGVGVGVGGRSAYKGGLGVARGDVVVHPGGAHKQQC